ncbi:MAG: SprB repeat-containing protein [Chitinophagales bacterium]
MTFGNQVNPGCGQSNGSVSVTLAGGSAPYQVTIDDGQGNQQSQTVPIAGTAPVANMAAATYTITVVDANSCSAIQTITFAAPAPPTVAVATTPGKLRSKRWQHYANYYRRHRYHKCFLEQCLALT